MKIEDKEEELRDEPGGIAWGFAQLTLYVEAQEEAGHRACGCLEYSDFFLRHW